MQYTAFSLTSASSFLYPIVYLVAMTSWSRIPRAFAHAPTSFSLCHRRDFDTCTFEFGRPWDIYLLTLVIVRRVNEVSTILPEHVKELIAVPFFTINTSVKTAEHTLKASSSVVPSNGSN